ncbi:MAG: hypothetical protein IPL52_06800 [Flavobacteriales bacterium]|nr:hypothetical protein [Flavobacteriales bacterium]
MRKSLFIMLLAVSSAHAQPYLIGSRSISFFDPVRARNIATELYYPGVSAGTNAAVESGAFPVLVIGHGFVMSTSAYANLWDYFVPKGYIVALPTTEGGFAPDHAEFGADIAFLAEALQAANDDGASPFFTHVAPTCALMGHSMGGGASLLGAAGNSAITTVVTFAPAETDPSAIAAASSILVPTLIFAGGNDCITPIADHAAPMYAALTTTCRAFVSITGGGHCYFAESNFNCSFGELTCSPSPDITRAQQHDVVNDFAGLWLDHYLKDDQQAFADVLDSLDLSTRAVSAHTCVISTTAPEVGQPAWCVVIDAACDRMQFGGTLPASRMRIIDMQGRDAVPPRVVLAGDVLDVTSLATGTYRVLVSSSSGTSTRPIVIIR